MKLQKNHFISEMEYLTTTPYIICEQLKLFLSLSLIASKYNNSIEIMKNSHALARICY